SRISDSTINFGASVSHGLVRAIAFGVMKEAELTGDTSQDENVAARQINWQNQNTTPEQRAQMDALIYKGLKQGAVGIGYHLAYTPGADHDEMLHFYELSAKEKVPNFVHY